MAMYEVAKKKKELEMALKRLKAMIADDSVTGIFIIQTSKKSEPEMHCYLGDEDPQEVCLRWIGLLERAKDFIKTLDSEFDIV